MQVLGERHLRIPRQMRPVYLVTAGFSEFRRAFTNKRFTDLGIDAVRMACRLLGMEYLELKQYIQGLVCGEFADHFSDQLLQEAMMQTVLGLDPMWNLGIKTGGATGGSAVMTGAMAIASGHSDCVMVVGWEKMGEVPTDMGNQYIAMAADTDWETPMGGIYTGYYAPMARRYWEIIAKRDPAFRRTMARIAVREFEYARHNPFAHGGKKVTVEEVEDSPAVAHPLLALDCCLMSEGAACCLLCDEATAHELTKHSQLKPLRLYIGAGSHTLRVADRQDMKIPLLPHETPEMYANLHERFPGLDTYPGFTDFLAARMAAYYVYGQAGITNPREQLGGVELHTAFTISDLQTYGDVGIRPLGEVTDYVDSGDCYHTNPYTGKPGKLPCNLSGGLMGGMHAVGATGIWQIDECALQLWGIHGAVHGDLETWRAFNKKKPDDWVDLQIAGVKRMGAVSHAGVGSHVTMCVLMNPDSLLIPDTTGKEVAA